MERINVTDSFRFHHTNCSFRMEFKGEVDMRKVYEVMETAVVENTDDTGYAKLWLQDLADCCSANHFDISSTLSSYEYNKCVPEMCKAVAKAFPILEFKVSADYDDTRCFYIDKFEASYNDHRLVITETFMDEDYGYFCPECGEFVDYPYAEFDCGEIICDSCDEIIKVADLKYIPADITTTEFVIK